MSVLLTADLHLSENPRDSYRGHFQKWLRDYVTAHNEIDDVYILGDLTEAKDRHSAWLVNQVVDSIYALSGLCPVTIICGNHDRADADQPFFEFAKRLHDVTWINKPKLLGGYVFLPHTDNYEKDWKDWFLLDNIDAYFCHATFDGATERGVRYNGIPASIFPKGSRVYSGDIHTPQKVGPVTYVGAPYLIDFGDDYEPRVIVLEGNKEISVPVPGPQKRLIIWGDNQHDVKPGDVLKVRVRLTPKDSVSWWDVRDDISAWASTRKCSINSIEPIVEYGEAAKIKPSEAVVVSDEELMKSYAERQGLDDKTLQTGLDLLK